MPELGAALKFDEHDLVANRAGRLSIRQRNRVFARQRGILIALTIITVFIGVLSAVVIVALLVIENNVSEIGLLLALGGEVITVGLAFLIWNLWQRFRAHLTQPYVQQVSGPVTCYVLRERKAGLAGGEMSQAGYYLQIGEMEFDVSDHTISAFNDGASYTVYYIQRPLRLLSAETNGSDYG